METLERVQEVLEMLVHPHLVNRSLAPLLMGDMHKLFPVTAKDSGSTLKRNLMQELRSGLAMACPKT